MKNILMLDDSKFSCKRAAEMITSVFPDTEITKAFLPSEALRIVLEEKKPFDLIVTDFNMPEMNGLEFIEKIKSEYSYDKIILLTATSAFTTKAQQLPEGIRLIQKPFSPEKFINAVSLPDNMVGTTSNEMLKIIPEAFTKGVQEATVRLSDFMDSDETFSIGISTTTVVEKSHFDELFKEDHLEMYGFEVLNGTVSSGIAALIFSNGEGDHFVSAILKEPISESEVSSEKEDILTEISNIVINICIEHLAPTLEKPLVGNVPRKISDKDQLKPEAQSIMLKSKFTSNSSDLTGDVTILLPINLLDRASEAS